MYIDLVLDLKPYLGISNSETGDDALLYQFIQRAQTFIDSYTGRTFEASTNTIRYFDPTVDVRGRMLYLDADLCAVNAITNGDSTAVTAYVTEPRNITPYYAILLKASANVSWTYEDTPENAITVSGKWAYSLTAPNDIKAACVRLVHYLYKQKDSGSELDRAVFAGAGTILPASLPADIRTMLDPYKRR